jgi:hypothetical protein
MGTVRLRVQGNRRRAVHFQDSGIELRGLRDYFNGKRQRGSQLTSFNLATMSGLLPAGRWNDKFAVLLILY